MSGQYLTLTIGEHESDGYHLCDECGGMTMLISSPCSWSVDSEPYKAGEEVETDEGDQVEIPAEVTAHYCPVCHKITSLSFNQ